MSLTPLVGRISIWLDVITCWFVGLGLNSVREDSMSHPPLFKTRFWQSSLQLPLVVIVNISEMGWRHTSPDRPLGSIPRARHLFWNVTSHPGQLSLPSRLNVGCAGKTVPWERVPYLSTFTTRHHTDPHLPYLTRFFWEWMLKSVRTNFELLVPSTFSL